FSPGDPLAEGLDGTNSSGLSRNGADPSYSDAQGLRSSGLEQPLRGPKYPPPFQGPRSLETDFGLSGIPGALRRGGVHSDPHSPALRGRRGAFEERPLPPPRSLLGVLFSLRTGQDGPEALGDAKAAPLLLSAHRRNPVPSAGGGPSKGEGSPYGHGKRMAGPFQGSASGGFLRP